MRAQTSAWILLAALLGAGTTAHALAFVPDMLREPERESTPAERAEYERLFADKILVKKAARKLYLLRDDKPFRTYRISLGFEPEGHKQRQGDGRTPEGRYYVDWRNPGSKFHKSLHVSYPNARDRRQAMSKGVDPGGMIMLHGQPGGGRVSELRRAISKEDWTHGCIAVSNMAIDEIWSYTRDGVPIEIEP